jgi:hypothetical protein
MGHGSQILLYFDILNNNYLSNTYKYLTASKKGSAFYLAMIKKEIQGGANAFLYKM